jgi:hypothetical protein
MLRKDAKGAGIFKRWDEIKYMLDDSRPHFQNNNINEFETEIQLVVSNLTQNKTKLKDVMCDATHGCLDGEHCCYNLDGTPAGCCDDGFVCDVPAGTRDLKGYMQRHSDEKQWEIDEDEIHQLQRNKKSNSKVSRSIALLQKRPQVRC